MNIMSRSKLELEFIQGRCVEVVGVECVGVHCVLSDCWCCRCLECFACADDNLRLCAVGASHSQQIRCVLSLARLWGVLSLSITPVRISLIHCIITAVATDASWQCLLCCVLFMLAKQGIVFISICVCVCVWRKKTGNTDHRIDYKLVFICVMVHPRIE